METQERQYFILRGTVQRQRLDADIDRILALYNDHGYIQARVESHDVAVDRENARVTITIDVVEGPQFRVGEIKHDRRHPAARRARSTGRSGSRPATSSRVTGSATASQRILNLYSTIGRASADVNPRTRPACRPATRST